MFKGGRDYDIGSVVRYRPNGGGSRDVKVEDFTPDVKNGYAGFDGEVVNIAAGMDATAVGDGAWGFDDQITDIITR